MSEQPPRIYPFTQVDVFTDRLFGGNPLAVFLDGAGLSDDEMQAIAREMNLSETTFLLPPTRDDCIAQVRIFTPGRELPFAGHPTIGTAFVLANRELIPPEATEFSLEEGVGPVPVWLEGDAAAPSFIWMRHPAASFDEPLTNPEEIARALGLSTDDLLPNAPIQSGSTGVSFLYVPLRDAATVDRAQLDPAAYLAAMGGDNAPGVFVFAPNPSAGPNHVYSRMFGAHAVGIPEDPATGSASGPLGAYLVRQGLASPTSDDGEVHIVSEQGTKMGRQSFIHILVRPATGEDGEQDTGELEIEVGGGVVPVLDGNLWLE